MIPSLPLTCLAEAILIIDDLKTFEPGKFEWLLHVDGEAKRDDQCIRDSQKAIYPDGVQLFNLKDDISETTNLAENHPEIVKELMKVYKAWRAEMANPAEPDWGLY